MDNNNKIINLLEQNKIQEAKLYFIQYILRPSQMNNIVYNAFQNNKDNIGKQIINFNFIMNNQGYKYNYSPFDFFCYVCKNEYLEILFRIIEDSYFWNKDKIIFEPEFQQTPRQWLIATAGYIMCSLNKLKSLEIICDKYNITKFDADKTKFFEIASKNNFEEIFTFLINKYGNYQTVEYKGFSETSLYDVPQQVIIDYYTPIFKNKDYIFSNTSEKPKTIDNPMYSTQYQNKTGDNSIVNSIDNPLYNFIKKINS
jgi:hypothetical protein